MSSDVLARVRAEIDARLVQLRAAVTEYERLLDAERALDADAAAATKAQTKAKKQAKKQANKQKAQPREDAHVPAPTRSKRSPATAPTRRGRRGSAAGAIKRATSSPPDASQQAIVAALEHGSHTLGELVLVTAIAAAELRQGVRGLQQAGTIARTKRDGRTAYALSSATG
ncbi:MAG: hypothetical protein ABR992_17860 [Solirubrobacteraceae bacterium]